MGTRVKIVLHGDTLLLAGLHASLAAYAGLEVLCVAASPAEEELNALRPDVVIVDTSSINFAVFRLLMEAPAGLHIFGVNTTENRVLVWSGQALPASSTRELVELIGQYSRNRADVA